MVVGPAGIDGLSNTTLVLAAAGQEPEMLTDSAGAYWAARRSSDGSWGESKTDAGFREHEDAVHDASDAGLRVPVATGGNR